MAFESFNKVAGIDNSRNTVTLNRKIGGFSFRGFTENTFSKCDILIDKEKRKLAFRFNDKVGYSVQKKSKSLFVRCIRIFKEQEWLKNDVLELYFSAAENAWVAH